MYELTHHQAQSIVNRMMKDIPYNINIMDQTGIIIGSGNQERIGTLHHGAVKAIKQKKIVEINNDEAMVKKGINLPIELNGKIVGVVGISGEVQETRPFGNLVKSAVILLIDQSMILEKENLKNNLKQEFWSLIINSDTLYTKDLINQALTYNIHLTKPSQIIYVESPDEIAEDITTSLASFKMSKNSLCIVVQETDKMEIFEQQIRNQHPDAFISISNMNDTISDGLVQAKSALRVLRGVYFNEKTIFYSKCEFIADLSKLHRNDTKADRLAHLLEKNDELIQTLQVYLNCNLNANETAGRLMIHRNTLNYRLNKITKVTGKDPKNILELVELIFMLINRIK
ncbi:CdaR family transcriptional regulator [Paenibacillus donghaensis]|uniref:Sugar diacid utilization regulator n=1 Tax=Paenibacillus donghaensis TaxID=414771 RepID=A0A2Z2KJ76_9BACL|nr:sugar diacid recognition domain-containing protein [Paenibacillus donghaensis]ASA23330.1 sugar diacid utilization regulator [Paenibacillus donghaensis]